MSETITTIKNTGRKKANIVISEFYGGKENGRMLQISQGFGMDLNEPGFIQLTKEDVEKLLEIFNDWK